MLFPQARPLNKTCFPQARPFQQGKMRNVQKDTAYPFRQLHFTTPFNYKSYVYAACENI